MLAYLVRSLLRNGFGLDGSVPDGQAVDAERLASAVEPYTLAHAAAVADVPTASLERLLAGIRRDGRVAVDTGTGVTMSASANVTQWLAWALMIVTGSMNRPGGGWFHPGFAHQLESGELPVSPASGSGVFGPGAASRPGTQAFLGEWPCAVLPDELRAGNVRAVLNLGGHLVTAFPDTSALVPALRELDVLATIEIVANETTSLSTHVLPTKDQLERADVTLWDFLSPRVAAQHTPGGGGAGRRPPLDLVGARRSPRWPVGWGPTGDDVTDDTLLAGLASRSRVPYEAHVARLGGWRLVPQPLVDQLAVLSSASPPDLVMVPRRQVRKLNSQFGYLGEPPEIVGHGPDPEPGSVYGISRHGEISRTQNG